MDILEIAKEKGNGGADQSVDCRKYKSEWGGGEWEWKMSWESPFWVWKGQSSNSGDIKNETEFLPLIIIYIILKTDSKKYDS